MKKVGKKAYSKRLKNLPDLLSIANSYPNKFPALLGSEAKNPQTGRYSFLFQKNNKVHYAFTNEEVDALFELIDSNKKQNKNLPLPFYSGWFVYLAYESVKSWEPSLSDLKFENDQPLMVAFKCNSAIIVDHKKNKAWSVGSSKKRVKSNIKLVKNTGAFQKKSNQFGQLKNNDHEKYIAGVSKIQNYIKQGDIYQVNLARKWSMSIDSSLSIFSLYQELSKNNPSPFAGILNTEKLSIVSSSPERLVKVKNKKIESRPIAGTRPRGKDKIDDQKLIKELKIHPKEQAEHIMLVDLVRNDIGRVSQKGSVKVDEFMIVESYAKVHHIVSNVIGEIDKKINFKDIIKAVFPGGTITGCPKIRCMQIIDEIETHPRGVYTGSMGYVSNHGEMDLNILIRTISINNQKLEIKAGAGIVFDSIPENESQESYFKAQALINSVKP